MQKIESEELRPCPFCGEHKAKVRERGPKERTAHQVQCICGSGTDWFTSARSAIAAWNRRAQTAGEGVTAKNVDTIFGLLQYQGNLFASLNDDVTRLIRKVTALEAALRDRDGNGFGKAKQ